MTSLRSEVLRVFKSLHRARLSKFEGDDFALSAARKKINEEFKKYKHVTNEASIQELIKLSVEVENEIRTNLIQAVKTKPNVYEVKITPETTKLTNYPYRDVPEEELRRRKPSKPCSTKEKLNE